jgi:ferredoxin
VKSRKKKTKKAKKPKRTCRACGTPERITPVGAFRYSNLSLHTSLCPNCEDKAREAAHGS